jgi:hypothetical protein
MKWPPAGNFKSHTKSLTKYENAVFLFDHTMDFPKLVNYICEYITQVCSYCFAALRIFLFLFRNVYNPEILSAGRHYSTESRGGDSHSGH